MNIEQKKHCTIGLIVASLHTGASLDFWKEVAKEASLAGYSLFVFAGGRLESPEGQEYLRNTIYPLANTHNIDARISWSSSLSGYVTPEAVIEYLEASDPMPTVSIGIKKPGSPSVYFDAYAGIQSLIYHCIRVHDARRIAFIRGPEIHDSAQDRWRAYVDTLTQCGIIPNVRLISDPMPWTEGRQAIDQLLIERSLVPGVDFDTLVCSSDMMMFDASKRLEELGYVIGEDLRIVGYNDSQESKLLRLPATTSRMPVQELAEVSFALLRSLERGIQEVNSFDILLPTQLIIRRSCGCHYSLGTVEQARQAVGDIESYTTWLIKVLKLKHDDALLLREILFAPLSEQERLDAIEELVYGYLSNDGDPSLLSEALFFYSEFFGSADFAQGLAHTIQEIFLRKRDLVAHEHLYSLSVQANHLDAFKGALLQLRSLDAIPSLMQQHLRQIGIEQGYLILFEGEYSHFIGGYADEALFTEAKEFAKEHLLPSPFAGKLPQGVYVVEPLYMKNQPLGYLVLGTTEYSGLLMEEIRSAVSSAVQGALLLDAANRAKGDAERSERKLASFFANVGESIRQPLEQISTLLKVQKESGYAEMVKEVAKVSHLLELSLSYTGELELQPETFDPSELLAHSGLPTILFDPSRLRQILEIISTYMQEHGEQMHISSMPTALGLTIRIASDRTAWSAEIARENPGLLLAQRIVFQSGGSMQFAANEITICLPWPTLSGEDASSGNTQLYYLASAEEKVVPPSFASLDGIEVVYPLTMPPVQIEKLSQGVLVWDGGRDTPELTLLLHQLSRHPQLSRTPMICTDAPVGYHSLFAALTTTRRAVQTKAQLLLIGTVDGSVASDLGMEQATYHVQAESALAYATKAEIGLIISAEEDLDFYQQLRRANSSPILIIKPAWSDAEIQEVDTIPNLLIGHPHILASPAFLVRLAQLVSGEGTLPSSTGTLVKRAIAYFDTHAHKNIFRWQVAEAAHVSEDYLSRIFNREMGLSPWEYLSRLRIARSVELLEQSALSINEIARQVGFRDQAYFCRVFRRIQGFPPSKLRTAK